MLFHEQRYKGCFVTSTLFTTVNCGAHKDLSLPPTMHIGAVSKRPVAAKRMNCTASEQGSDSLEIQKDHLIGSVRLYTPPDTSLHFFVYFFLPLVWDRCDRTLSYTTALHHKPNCITPDNPFLFLRHTLQRHITPRHCSDLKNEYSLNYYFLKSTTL